MQIVEYVQLVWVYMPEDVEKPKNIFEAAASIGKARVRKQTPVKPKGELPVAVPGEVKGIVSEIFIKAKKLHEEIASQVDSLFTKNKVAPSNYRRYVSRPQNFSQNQWQQLEEQRGKNELLLRELAKKIGAKAQAPPEQKKEEEKEVEKKPPLEKEAAPSEKKPPPVKETAPPEKKTPTKKPKIITRRQWIGM